MPVFEPEEAVEEAEARVRPTSKRVADEADDEDLAQAELAIVDEEDDLLEEDGSLEEDLITSEEE